jgi:hypothetical protein
MVIDTAKKSVTTSVRGEQKRFTIAESPEAFEILSSALYEDPMLAIVREIVCNALDAHTLAGVKRPPRVTLPDEDHDFIVEDFGRGMSEAEIDEIYTSYFVSSKSSTNDQIGAFGLGAKTPFAYTNEFVVETGTGDGRRTYLMYKDEEGYPKPMITSTSDSNETGTKVTVAVKRPDRMKWVHNAITIFAFLETMPEIVNPSMFYATCKAWAYHSSESDDPEVLFARARETLKMRKFVSNNEWDYKDELAYKIAGSYGSVIVIMGGVGYGVNPDTLLSEKNYSVKNMACYFGLDRQDYMVRLIHADIGEFPVSPSRENLSFKGDTDQRLFNKMVAEVNAFYVPFLSLKNDKERCEWLATCGFLKQVTKIYYDFDKAIKFPEEFPWIKQFVRTLTDLQKQLELLNEIVCISRMNSKSFKVNSVIRSRLSGKLRTISIIDQLKRGYFFLVNHGDFREAIINGVEGNVLKHYKMRRVLQYLIENVKEFNETFHEENGCFICTQDGYDTLSKFLDVPETFELMKMDVPRKSVTSTALRKPKSDRVFDHNGKKYSYDEITAMTSDTIYYQVTTEEYGCTNILLLNHSNLKKLGHKCDKASATLKTISGGYRLDSLSAWVEYKWNSWCDKVGIPLLFKKLPFIVTTTYGNFKRFSLWKDPKFDDAVMWYGKEIMTALPSLLKVASTIHDVPHFFDEHRQFTDLFYTDFTKRYRFIMSSSKFEDWARVLIASPVKGTNGRAAFYEIENIIDTMALKDYGFKIPNLKFTFADNIELYKSYPMLQFLEEDWIKDKVTNMAVKVISDYIALIDEYELV